MIFKQSITIHFYMETNKNYYNVYCKPQTNFQINYNFKELTGIFLSDMTNALVTVGSTNTTVLAHVVDKYIAGKI